MTLTIPQTTTQVRTLVALLVMFGVLFAYAAAAPPTPASPGVLDPLRIKAAEQQRVREGLRDPDSARFRDDFVARPRGMLVVCGEVNHRNDVGAYLGYRRYISGPTFKALEDGVGADAMAELWASMCSRSP